MNLFSPYSLKATTLRNRIVASPMCQYQAEDGFANNWHWTHYTTLGRGGSGLVILEATAVVPEGRITPGDLGIWRDEHVPGLTKIADNIRSTGAAPGIQLGHAGRKAGALPPWEGGMPVPKGDPRAWEPVGPSPLPFKPAEPHMPREMTQQDIDDCIDAFAKAAGRAAKAGFEWLELHFAHGFLAQNFLSKHSNARTDAYGGSLENRARFLIEAVTAIRTTWPSDRPLTMRLGVIEFGEGEEQNFEDAIQVLKWLKDAGLDFVDVGMARSVPTEQVPWTANIMVPYAARIRDEVGIPVSTSWLITSATDADRFVAEGHVDLVYLARTLLANPHWPYQAAEELGLPDPASVLPTPYAYWLRNWNRPAR